MCGILIGFTIRELLNEPLAEPTLAEPTFEVDVERVIDEVFTDEPSGE